MPDDRFGGRPDDEFLFQTGFGVDDYAAAVFGVLKAVVGDYGALLGEALDVIGLAAQE